MEVEQDENNRMSRYGHSNHQTSKMNGFAFDETPSFFDMSKTRSKVVSNDFTPFDVTSTINTDVGSSVDFGLKNRFKAHRFASTDSEKTLFKSNKQIYIGERSEDKNKENSNETVNSLIPNKSLLHESSEVQILNKQELLNSRASILLGYDVRNEEDIGNCWVTIFGFESKLSQYITDYFKQFGEIQEIKSFSNANFLFVKYFDREAAISAEAQNGSLLKLGGYNIFVGVKPGVEGSNIVNSLSSSDHTIKATLKKKNMFVGRLKSFDFKNPSNWLALFTKVGQWILLGK